MAPVATTTAPSAAFFRSHSSPDLQSMSFSRPPLPRNSPSLNKALPRIPSFDSFEIPSFDAISDLDTKLSFPGTSLPKLESSPVITPATTISNKDAEQPASRFRRNLSRPKTASRPKSWLAGLKSNKEDDAQPVQYLELPPVNDGTMARHPSLKERGRSATDTLTTSFARRSWISRTPSPRIVTPPPPDNSLEETPKAASKGALRKLQAPAETKAPEAAARSEAEVEAQKSAPFGTSKAGAFFSKHKPKSWTLVNLDWGADSDSCASSAASLSQTGPQSMTSRTSQSTSSERSNAPHITDESSKKMTPQDRDSLWPTFKNLGEELKEFGGKQLTQRIAQIQTSLLPFLRATMHHPSTKKLHEEHIERRALILNDWWNAILDMLDSQANQPIPGVDRPILLEAATMLMMRPEWRRTTPDFQPLADRCPTDKLRSRSRTTSSLDSQNSNVVDETVEQSREQNSKQDVKQTVEHNVRTMFVGNLVRQMSLVVEKMSLRHAPLTLVNFAGKTCAYAFFFAPDVADILLRLWGLTPELIRRAADELGLPRCDNGDGEDIAAFFPPELGSHAWNSPRASWNTLKHIPKMSVLVARIPWTGPWVSRWKGVDTDLFFIFCKYFYVLTDQFLLPDLPLAFKARAPAFVLVQAQLLSIIDSTIHRDPALGQGYNPPLVDSFHGADASAMEMPMPPSNLMKGMADNRLVALLKDFLLDDLPDFASAKATFAETFAAMMKAATQRTSKFNNSACFTLCDFLEEVLVIYDKYEIKENVASCIDWKFWTEVLKHVISSMNAISQVRVISFIYTIWNVITREPSRKAELCFDWLLTEDTFNAFFTSWCSIVRSFYHRLLCWRICRYDGLPSDVDMAVFRLAAKRLRSVWSHYLYLKEAADETGRQRPSSAPMWPAVGKRFIIIRQEVHAPQPGLVTGLDTFARTPSGTDLAAMDDYTDSSQPKGDQKKRWSLFGKVLSFTNVASAVTMPNPAGLPKSHSFDGLQIGRQETTEARSRPSTRSSGHSQKLFQIGGSSATSDTESRCSTPLLDEPGFVFKFVLIFQKKVGPERHRILNPPQLPGPAQYRLNTPGYAKRPAPLDAHRQVSSSSQPGLIDRAKNATPLSTPHQDSTRRLSLAEPLHANYNDGGPAATRTGVSSPSDDSDATRTATPNTGYLAPEETRPSKPAGVWARNAIYSGHALAEWTQVLNECNSFVDRRTDEGVDRLRDMDVPMLTVEGFRKLGG